MRSGRKLIFGLILILVGLCLLGRSFSLFCFSFGDLMGTLVPLALIALGIWLIIRKRRRIETISTADGYPGPPPPPPYSGSGSQPYSETMDGPSVEGYAEAQAQAGAYQSTAAPRGRMSEQPSVGERHEVRYSKFLGDMFVDCTGINLRNVEMSIGVGDLEVHLRGGQFASGLNRLIISGFVGDVRVFVPDDVPYSAHCSNFVGDIQIPGRAVSGFGSNLESQTPDYESAESKLYLAINNFVGDIKIFAVSKPREG